MEAAERVLLVHAHPDDETISTGGTIALLVERGAAVTVLTCTRGELGDVVATDLQHLAGSPGALAAHREAELAEAMRILGVSDHRYLGDHDARWPGREPRRYLDSGMQWTAAGKPGPLAVLDPASLVAAEPGEIAADIAAVISAIDPDAVISYDASGGYGHPDHIRVHEAARRAAGVLGVAFYEIVPNGRGRRAISVDISPVYERKRSALAAYRSQLDVRGDQVAVQPGDYQPIGTTESFRQTRPEFPPDMAPFAGSNMAVKVATAGLALVIGFVVGGILTVTHQATTEVLGVWFPWGIVSGIVITAALLAGLRLVFGTRIVAGFAAAGLLAAVAVLSIQTAGGSILVPANVAGYAWTFGPTLIAAVVLAWPRFGHRPTGKIAGIPPAKGTDL